MKTWKVLLCKKILLNLEKNWQKKINCQLRNFVCRYCILIDTELLYGSFSASFSWSRVNSSISTIISCFSSSVIFGGSEIFRGRALGFGGEVGREGSPSVSESSNSGTTYGSSGTSSSTRMMKLFVKILKCLCYLKLSRESLHYQYK